MSLVQRVIESLDSAAFARAYAICAFAATLGAGFIQDLVGAVTVTTIMTCLVVIGLAVLVVRRRELSLLRIVPSSIVLFVAWMAASLAWTTDAQWTVIGVVGAVGYATIAVVIANTRDTLQTVRALGDVLRVLLVLSLALELLSGVFLDMPLEVFGIQGKISQGGPVQGIFQTRNVLGLVSVIALVTFSIELRTNSVPRRLGIFSSIIAVILIGLSLSPTAAVLVGVVGISALALALIRSRPKETHRALQLTLASVVIVAVGVGLLFRHQIIRILGAGTDFSMRADLWNAILDYSHLRVFQGWGYYGPWAVGEFPFWMINERAGAVHHSALNAFFDTLIQLGVVGLLILLFAGGLALARAWIIATERKSILYAWTPLVLITLLANSMVESAMISGFGFMLFVLCASRAGQTKSWREVLDAGRPQAPSAESR